MKEEQKSRQKIYLIFQNDLNVKDAAIWINRQLKGLLLQFNLFLLVLKLENKYFYHY